MWNFSRNSKKENGSTLDYFRTLRSRFPFSSLKNFVNRGCSFIATSQGFDGYLWLLEQTTKKRPRKKRGQSNRESSLSHCREVESNLDLARRCQKRKGRPNWLQEEWPTSCTDFENREVKSGPSHTARRPMGREQSALLVEEPVPVLLVLKEERDCSSNDCFASLYPHDVSCWDKLSRHNYISLLFTTYSYAITVLNFIHTQLQLRSYPFL